MRAKAETTIEQDYVVGIVWVTEQGEHGPQPKVGPAGWTDVMKELSHLFLESQLNHESLLGLLIMFLS